jgi:hypothetical protein
MQLKRRPFKRKFFCNAATMQVLLNEKESQHIEPRPERKPGALQAEVEGPVLNEVEGPAQILLQMSTPVIECLHIAESAAQREMTFYTSKIFVLLRVLSG